MSATAHAETITAHRVRLVMLESELRRSNGEIGPQDPVTPARMAEIAEELGEPLSEATFYRLISRAIHKIRHSHHIHPHH